MSEKQAVQCLWLVMPEWATDAVVADTSDDDPIYSLDLYARTLHLLNNMGITTVGKARRLQHRTALSTHGFGKTSWRDLQQALVKHRGRTVGKGPVQ